MRSPRLLAAFFALIVVISMVSAPQPTRVAPEHKPRPVLAAVSMVCDETAAVAPAGTNTTVAALAAPDYQAIVSPTDQQVRTLTYDGATLKIKPGAVKLPVGIGISSLNAEKVPKLDAGMTNVTAKPRRGYKFTPHPMTFALAIEITLPYDPALLDDSYTPQDIYTYFYDDVGLCWRQLPRVSVDEVNHTVTSLSDHFTDMINATVTVPEHPEGESFNPNQLKGIQAGDPSAQINLIAPPNANNQGDNRLSYPIEVPPGRQGIQPSLALDYDSSHGNGWMGVGWNLQPPNITIDTRWGVPRYDGNGETETYLLGGEQLTPVANRGTIAARTSEKVFHSRIEGGFQRIVRHGSTPANYTWEVTDKTGTTWLYGSTSDSVLRDKGNHAFEWYLAEVRDLRGNFMRYHYASVSDPGVAGGTEPGSNVYLQRITYTGEQGVEGHYAVTFIRDRELSEPKRLDTTLDGRGGFKRVTADLLRKINVTLDGSLIRRYEFAYATGAFYKTLLHSVTQFDANGAVFNTHSFDYFDDIRDSQGNYQAFQTTSWTTPGDNLGKGELNLTPDNAGDASAINANTSLGGGGHLYVGVSGPNGSKSGSIGVKVGFNHNEDSGLLALVDVDGDNLPDKVYRGGSGIMYRKNLSGPHGVAAFSDTPKQLTLPAIMGESTNSITVGIEGYLSGVAAQLDYVNSFASTNQYFADVNGDSIIDLVDGSNVLFGRLGSDGVPVYGVSADTPVPITQSHVDTTGIVGDLSQDRERMIDSFPLLDSVRRWVAPYDGTVSITGTVKLSNSTAGARATSTIADGVRAAIQLEDTELWSDQIGPQDNTAHTPVGVGSVHVTRGQRLYFRLQSNFDGSLDEADWDPSVTYTGVPATTDVNGLSAYGFQASRDFTLGGRTAQAKVPLTGSMHLSGDLTKSGITTDDVTVVITRDGSPVFQQTMAAGNTGTIPVNLDLSVSAGQLLKWRIQVDSPIDVDQVAWTPRAYYTASPGLDRINDTHGNPLVNFYPPYDLDMYPVDGLTAPQDSFTVAQDGTLTVDPELAFAFGGAQVNGRVAFTVKRRGALMAKSFFTIADGVVTAPAPLNVAVTAGQELLFDFSTSDPTLRTFLTSQAVHLSGGSVMTDGPSAFHSAAQEGAFAQPYRGWGAIGYNGNRDRATQPIVQTDLVVDSHYADGLPTSVDPQAQKDAFRNDPRVNQPKSTPYAPVPNDLRWAAGDHSWVARASSSSSRMGVESIKLPQPSDFGNSFAVPRMSRTEQISLTGSVGGSIGSLGGSVATGTSTGQLDFIDMNGDGFPDVLGSGGIQYTDASGALGGTRGDLPDGAVRKADNVTGNASAGSAARTISTGRGQAAPPAYNTTNNSDAGNDMPPLGVGASFGGSSSNQQFDMIDMNGDGLPDRVYADGRVALNLGYSFGKAESWRNPNALNNGSGTSGGLNIGFNTDFYGFAGGASFSQGSNGTSASLQDVNGDGLLDRVFDGSPMTVSLNTGNGFEPPVAFHGSVAGLSKDRNAKLGGGVYFTIPICFIAVCIIINPGGDISEGASRSEQMLKDIDGDGYVDQLASTNDGQLAVRSNKTGRTNLLKTVTRPMGARMDFDYTRDGNSYDQPQSRWLLSRVSVNDGHPGDGQDVQLKTYQYSNGVYNRLEREFFGYGTVVEQVRDAGAGEAVYRSITRDYRTDSHYDRGLLTRELTADGAGRPFTETDNTYVLHEVGAGNADAASTTATVFPQLTRSDSKWFEGNPNPGKTSFTTMEYDGFGNITRSFDAADVGSADDSDSRVQYANCPATYVVGIPDVVDTTGGGTLMRHRESTVDCTTGEVTQVRAMLANGDASVNDMTYFDNGNLKSVTGPPNKIGQRYQLTYAYDTTVDTHIESITDSFELHSTSTHNFKFGTVESTTDFNNQVIRNTYDSVGRMIAVSGPYEVPQNRNTITFDYHPEAPVPYAATHHIDRNSDGTVKPDTIDTIIFADGMQRVIQTKKDAALSTGPNTAPQDAMVVSGRAIYDAVGRPIRQYYPVSEPKGPANTTFNASFDTVPTTTSTFDIVDRAIHVVLPDGTTADTSYGFGPDRAGVTRFEEVSSDANNKSKRVYHDVRNLTTAVKEFNPGTVWTSYTYDALGQPTSVTDDHNNVTTSTYDNLGRRTSVVSPDAGRTDTVYDLAGDMIKKITPKLAQTSQAIEYDYAFRRLVGIRYPTFTGNNVTYTYGAPGAANNGANRIIASTDGAGALTREYGPLGEVIKETRTSAGQGSHTFAFTTSYRYDTWNRVLSMTYPDGEVLTYHYNSGGQVDSATGAKAGFAYTYLQRLDYDKFEQRVLLDTGNGTRTQYTYNATDRRLRNLHATLAQGYVFQNLNYTYDQVGNITAVSNDTTPPSSPDVGMQVGGPTTETFQYDDLYQLTHAEGTYQPRTPLLDRYRLDISYDSIHNITSKNQVHELVSNGNVQTDAKFTYDNAYAYGGAQPHAPTSLGIYTISYDADGNQISRDQQPQPRRQLIWDEEDRLACSHENVQSLSLPQTPASCDNAGGTPNRARYLYDDQGNRVIKDSSTFHVYPNANYSTDGTKEYKHIYVGQTKLLTQAVFKNTNRSEDQQFYSHGDQLRSTQYVTDASGGMAEHLEYFAGGETWVSEHPSQPVPQQFTGKELDPETDLYYFGSRYYDPRTQLWQSPDKALESYLDGQPNGGARNPVNLALYTYAYNSPIRLSDPDGLFPWNRVIGGVKMVGGILEASAGVAVGAATSWTGVGAVGGAVVAVHGFDVALSGARQLVSGEETSSFTSSTMQAAGVSKDKAELLDATISVVGSFGAATATSMARAGATATRTAVQVGTRAPAALAAGNAFEDAYIAARAGAGWVKNTAVFRPSAQQISSQLFKDIVGVAEYTPKGKAVGTIVDVVLPNGAVEIKSGTSLLESSYQLRLQVYEAVVKGRPLIIHTQRPIEAGFAAFLQRWGVSVVTIP
jgi:RHS repeat-associated protein